jgi:hypothetical protein
MKYFLFYTKLMYKMLIYMRSVHFFYHKSTQSSQRRSVGASLFFSAQRLSVGVAYTFSTTKGHKNQPYAFVNFVVKKINPTLCELCALCGEKNQPYAL